MKKSLIFIILIFLTACSLINSKGTNIQTPKIIKPPIYGKWTITKFISSDKLNEDNFEYKDIIGVDVLFACDEAMIAGDYIKDPSYRTKYVNLATYLYKKYNLNFENLNVPNKEAYAISIRQNDSVCYEVIKYSDDTAFIIRNNFIFQISKTDDELTEKQLKLDIAEKKEEGSDLTIETISDKTDNGLMLGLREPNESKLPSYNYKTIYIKFSSEGLENVYETPNILLPRVDGFYQVEIQRVSKQNEISDNLIIKKRPDQTDASQDKGKILQIENRNVLKDIAYIGDELINIENINVEDNSRNLRIYKIDDIEKKRALGIDYFIKSERSGDIVSDINSLLEDEKNIGIFRMNGYWKLMGRNNQTDGIHYNDFDLNIVLANSINKYNVLSIPMADIKKFHTKIRDAFISPDNKYLITLENTMIKIYNIENGNIIKNPIFEREIGEETSVIMSQWSIGKYSNLWQKEITRKN